MANNNQSISFKEVLSVILPLASVFGGMGINKLVNHTKDKNDAVHEVEASKQQLIRMGIYTPSDEELITTELKLIKDLTSSLIETSADSSEERYYLSDESMRVITKLAHYYSFEISFMKVSSDSNFYFSPCDMLFRIIHKDKEKGVIDYKKVYYFGLHRSRKGLEYPYCYMKD